MSPADLYDRDFYEWTVRNAELLRSGRATEADLEHIAEEIEDMGKREQRELYSRLKVLIAHLLKWQVQPDRRGSSWESTILVQRRDLKRLLAQNPSLKPHLAEQLKEAYSDAVLEAMAQTLHPESDFPNSCPYELEALLDPDFLP
jgi:hypothetical protein